MVTRRQLLKQGAAGGAAITLARLPLGAFARTSPGVSPRLRKWVEPLPVPPVLDAKAGGARFTIAAAESQSYRFHRDLGAAQTWGYGGAPYLGPTIEARQFVPLTVEWQNDLDTAFVPNDPTLMGAAMPGDPAPMVAHLHGGENLPQCDGTPLQWFRKDGTTGPHFVTREFLYTNEQRASTVWYHDHAVGNTRTNVYAGLAGMYFIRDEIDTGTPDNPLGLPAGDYEIPLVLQDKSFNRDGTMWYPKRGVTRFHPVWVPEFFGDVAVVNGKAWPRLDVEPRRYRLRVLNGAQARFFRMRFVDERTREPLRFHQIGSEGGLLRAPVELTSLVIGPGERADLIVDFTGHRGTAVTITNDARAPYPSGEPTTLRELVRLRVGRRTTGRDESTPARRLRLPELPPLPAPSMARRQELSERIDPRTDAPVALSLEGGPYLDPDTGLPEVTTRPHAEATEDWLLVNTTADTHPIHVHLVNFEVIDRRPFDLDRYAPGRPIPYRGRAIRRRRTENGLKDTVHAPPGYVTRIRMKFHMPDEEIVLPPGLEHPQYVWHCHILEHEENDMMRAFEVVP